MVDVCLPGTGGMIPLPNRWLSCCWIERDGKAILIDCGEGTQIALRKSKLNINRLHFILITHFHADHIAGLPGLLLTLGNCGRTAPLTIMGPPGLSSVVSSLLVIAPELPFSLQLCEMIPNTTHTWGNSLEISTLALSHGIPCLGYRVTIKRKPVFNPKKAQALGIPLRCYHVLHEGGSIIQDGHTVTPEMVTDEARAPIQICYCTDSHPLDTIAAFAANADLFICEGMYGDDAFHLKMQEKGHMVFSDSARLAKAANVKRLWITHYSSALQNPDEFLMTAQQIFPRTTTGFDGIKISLPAHSK